MNATDTIVLDVDFRTHRFRRWAVIRGTPNLLELAEVYQDNGTLSDAAREPVVTWLGKSYEHRADSTFARAYAAALTRAAEIAESWARGEKAEGEA
jgi:hypothetical protein